MVSTIVNVVVFVTGLSLLVYLHELGHVTAAKVLGVRVEVCCFGFGPTVFQHRVGDTFWRIAIVPFGGWTKLAGEVRAEATGDPQEFVSRPLWTRVAIGAMGSVANAFVALLIAVGSCLTGMGPVRATTVLVVNAESTALVGLKPGDVIVAVNGVPVGFCDQRAGLFEPDADEITFQRGMQTLTRAVPLLANGFAARSCPLLSHVGVILDRPLQTAVGRVGWSLSFVKRFASITLVFMGRAVTLRLSPKALPGPIRFLQVAAGCSAGSSVFLILLSMASLWLAIFNLLPIPILDGCVILVLVIEELAGELPPRLKETVFKAGYLSLLVAVVFFIHNDISRLPFWR